MPVDLLGGEASWMGDCKWYLVSRPLGACGNKTTSLDAEAVADLQTVPLEGGIEALLGGEQTHRFIHPEELGVAAEMVRWRDDAGAWETLNESRSNGVVVKRRAGESLAGPITVLVDARMPGIPLEVTADALSNFSERSHWDTQQIDFNCHDEWGCPPDFANGLFSFTLHVPPLADRDFVNFHLMARRADGDGYMTLTREAAHPSYPPTQSKVRGKLFSNVLYCNRDEKDPKSSRFCLIVKTDAKLGLVPFWLINIFIPGEMVKWKKKMDKVCAAKLKAYRAGKVSLVMSAVLNQPDPFPEPVKPVVVSSKPPSPEVVDVLPMETPAADTGAAIEAGSPKALAAAERPEAASELATAAVASVISVEDGIQPINAAPSVRASPSPSRTNEAANEAVSGSPQRAESRPTLPTLPALSSADKREHSWPAIDDGVGPKGQCSCSTCRGGNSSEDRPSSSCWFSFLRCY